MERAGARCTNRPVCAGRTVLPFRWAWPAAAAVQLEPPSYLVNPRSGEIINLCQWTRPILKPSLSTGSMSSPSRSHAR
jgi:hypothetical protein